METKDSVENILNDGDTVIVSKTLKRRNKIKNIRVINNPQNIELAN